MVPKPLKINGIPYILRKHKILHLLYDGSVQFINDININ